MPAWEDVNQIYKFVRLRVFLSACKCICEVRVTVDLTELRTQQLSLESCLYRCRWEQDQCSADFVEITPISARTYQKRELVGSANLCMLHCSWLRARASGSAHMTHELDFAVPRPTSRFPVNFGAAFSLLEKVSSFLVELLTIWSSSRATLSRAAFSSLYNWERDLLMDGFRVGFTSSLDELGRELGSGCTMLYKINCYYKMYNTNSITQVRKSILDVNKTALNNF